MKSAILLLTIFLGATTNYAQTITQNIRGVVVDSETHYPLIGTKVRVTTITDKVYGAVCDINGSFTIQDVPIGKHTIEARSVGYSTNAITVEVTSGREAIVRIELTEKIVKGTEVIVTNTSTNEVMNDMATVSATRFSVEETNRYAGSRADPARMVSNFAGATGTDDSRNDLVIRGNSPIGILYRIEGVAIPNPSHFAIAGSTGGPVSLLNNKILANSDFFMSAFPAEYGNSTSGVFDLKLRNGNNQNHEFTGQFGLLGTEVLVEGPLSKNSKASYLIMGRYSTLTMIDKIGIKYGTDAVPLYGDGAFKFNFPLKKGGQLALWGMGGSSNISILISDQTEPAQDAFGEQDRDQYFGSKMFVSGLTYKKPINKSFFVKTTLSYAHQNQFTNHEYILRSLNSNNEWVYEADPFTMMGYSYLISTINAHVSFNKKFNAKHVLKYGLNIDANSFNMRDSIRTDIADSTSAFYYRWDYKSSTPALLFQPFIQWKYNINERLTMNTGIHSQYFTLSNSLSAIEPRFGLKYAATENSQLAFGAGLHSQTQPLYIYTYQLANNNKPHNLEIDFTKSIHAVLSYSLNLSKTLQFKTEVYYQHLYDVPVEQKLSSFSLVNQGSGFARFFPDTLVNSGTGRNIGLELTLQKSFNNSFYFMTTVSIYDSKYTGSDGIERNTDFNGNYILNGLAGKSFKLDEKNKHVLALGMKVTYAGGKRYGLVDQEQTELNKEIVFRDEQYNEQRFRDYFRFDVKFNYTLNATKITHEIGVDLVNLLNTPNILGLTYTPNSPTLTTERYQLGFLPVFYYKIDFKLAKKKNINP
jgi:hypothetical protein